MNRSERSHAASPSDAMPIARARAAILAIQEIHSVLLPSAPCRHKLSAPLHMAWRCEFDGACPRPDVTPWMQSHQSSPRRHILASVALTNATASLRARARAASPRREGPGAIAFAAAVGARPWQDRNDCRFHGGRVHRRASIRILRCRSSSPRCSVRGASANVLPWRARPCHMWVHSTMRRVIPSTLVVVISPSERSRPSAGDSWAPASLAIVI